MGGGGSHQLQYHPETVPSVGKLLISGDCLRHGVATQEMARTHQERLKQEGEGRCM